MRWIDWATIAAAVVLSVLAVLLLGDLLFPE
jgi:hypothetical protein